MIRGLILLVGLLNLSCICFSQYLGPGRYECREIKCSYSQPRFGACAKAYSKYQTVVLTNNTKQRGLETYIQTKEGFWITNRFLTLLGRKSTTQGDGEEEEATSSDFGSPKVDCDQPPPVLDLIPSSLDFTDGNGNDIIDANEQCRLSFELENSGPGPSQFPRINAIGTNRSALGVWVDDTQAPSKINSNDSRGFVVFLSSDRETKDGAVTLQIGVTDGCGFGVLPFDVTLQTRSFLEPDVRIVDELSIPIHWTRGTPIQMKVLVQNLGLGLAEEVRARLKLPAGVICFSGNEDTSFGSLPTGETREIIYDILIPKTYDSEEIQTTIELTERDNRYSQDWTRSDNVGALPNKESFTIGGAVGPDNKEPTIGEIGQVANRGYVEFNTNPKDVVVDRVAVVAAKGMDCSGIERPGQDLASYVEGSLLGYYEVVERRNLERVLDEQKLALSGIMFEKSTVEAGCNIGAQGIIFTEFGCIGGQETIQVKLVDCQTSELYWSATGHGSSILDVVKEIKTNLDEK